MDFSAFDTSKMDEYAKQAKEYWGATPEYKEFEAKSGNRSKSEEKVLGDRLMSIIAKFGTLKTKPASDPEVQQQVKTLQDFISEHYYTCSNEILYSLGQMYAAGGEFTANIDAAGGAGTAEFACEAINVYCGKL